MASEAFYAELKHDLFQHGLSNSQASGIEAVLTAWEHTAPSSPLEYIAYSLATPMWETARSMQPIEELGRGRGRAYGIPTGPWHQVYDGRGDVQLTWIANYRKADAKLHELGVLKSDENMVKDPRLAMRSDVAAAVMIHGMLEGWFTGKKLSDFMHTGHFDALHARRIINGMDHAAVILGYYGHFLHALQLEREVIKGTA